MNLQEDTFYCSRVLMLPRICVGPGGWNNCAEFLSNLKKKTQTLFRVCYLWMFRFYLAASSVKTLSHLSVQGINTFLATGTLVCLLLPHRCIENTYDGPRTQRFVFYGAVWLFCPFPSLFCSCLMHASKPLWSELQYLNTIFCFLGEHASQRRNQLEHR